MKRFILFSLSICFFGMVHAQFKPAKQPVMKPVLQKPGNHNTGTNQQSDPVTTTLTDADYFLSVAKVTIKTGKDNKELNSKLLISVYPVIGTDNYKKGFFLENYMPELKIWSTNEFTLPKAPGFDKSFNSLGQYKQGGVMVDILYNTAGNGPFFITDAWKIDEVSVVLEFKDKYGNPHPTMPSKTIYFTNGDDMYLDFLKWHLYCRTDEYFNVLPPFITKRQ